VSEGICGGCHIRIPPQSFNELQKGKQILGCPNCQRIIFWVEHSPTIQE
jgi:predicted  nucleic acid-binding Zn-ribbon protein